MNWPGRLAMKLFIVHCLANWLFESQIHNKMKIETYNNMWYSNVKQKPICQNEKWRTEYRMIHSICFPRTFVCRESRQQDRLELRLPCVSFRMLSSLDQCYNAT